MEKFLGESVRRIIRGEDDNMADFWKEAVIKQGYVPKDCTLNGTIVWGLINRSEDPCSGCNENRNICKGRGPDEGYMGKPMTERV